jgi:predicted ribosomally synthesized peptide with SipW-like signal peptide
MNKQILLSILAVSTVVALVSGATYAYLNDAETSSGNTFTAGTFDLKIKDQDEGWKDGVTATWTATDMKPGDSYAFEVPFVNMKNVGSIPANHVEITSDYSVVEESPQTKSDTDPNTNLNPDKMAKQMIITRCTYYNSVIVNCLTHTDSKWRIEDTDSDGKITFFDLKNDKLDDLPAPEGPAGFEMSVKFDGNAGNDFQGDTFDLTVIFTLNQDSSQ